jgi:hypothetical protein
MTTPTIGQSLRGLVDKAKEIEQLLDASWPLDPTMHGHASALIFMLRLNIETQAMRAEWRESQEASE